ncbi:MAG: hypothetical protein K9W45_11180 [Candidatus Heimdallarchaeum aukensis]|uniref:CRISPR-associated protein n=1 Tax=Candidatus Heimdallarchaeum aukensis TaxID=2876573 RepID=A0A9Y1FKM0_9ARCH|nr:MAG: hypothetical protein K9W45_11180 [Candidatus Heimdallarchaeum aukensis]
MSYDLLYISLMGSSEKAVANSIYASLKNLVKTDKKNWVLVFAKSKSTPINGERIVEILDEYKNTYTKAKWYNAPVDFDEFEIEESNLLKSMEQIINYVEETEKNYSDIFIDITPGRKVMSVAATLAAINLCKSSEFNDIKIIYYLLKNVDEHKDKDAPELYPDEYKVSSWSVKDISKRI